ncbi:MAG: polysaccharide export protein [Aquabacterium sp.]
MAALVGAFAMAWLLAGCGTALPPAPASAAQAAQAYRIGPLDSLQVVVWHNPDLSGRVTVRPDGRISLPLVEELQAAGRDPEALARDIEQRLARYVQQPQVTVVLAGTPAAPTQQVRVIGEATRPQAVACKQGMTVLDVMTLVGGLTTYADGNGAVLVRNAENGTQYRLRLKDLLKRGDISANAEVIPGDIIIVPESVF